MTEPLPRDPHSLPLTLLTQTVQDVQYQLSNNCCQVKRKNTTDVRKKSRLRTVDALWNRRIPDAVGRTIRCRIGVVRRLLDQHRLIGDDHDPERRDVGPGPLAGNPERDGMPAVGGKAREAYASASGPVITYL